MKNTDTLEIRNKAKTDGSAFPVCHSGTKVQSLIFDKDKFTAKEAQQWAKDHHYTGLGVDEKESTYRLRQEDPSEFKKGYFRTVPFNKNIKAVIGCPISKSKMKFEEGGAVTVQHNFITNSPMLVYPNGQTESMRYEDLLVMLEDIKKNNLDNEDEIKLLDCAIKDVKERMKLQYMEEGGAVMEDMQIVLPKKRPVSEVLDDLYHEHHETYDAINKIDTELKSEKKSHIELSGDILNLWNDSMHDHFEEEEHDLFPLITGMGEDTDIAIRDILEEHVEIEFLVNKIRQNRNSKDLIIKFVDIIKHHINEEEDLFSQFRDDKYWLQTDIFTKGLVSKEAVKELSEKNNISPEMVIRKIQTGIAVERKNVHSPKAAAEKAISNLETNFSYYDDITFRRGGVPKAKSKEPMKLDESECLEVFKSYVVNGTKLDKRCITKHNLSQLAGITATTSWKQLLEIMDQEQLKRIYDLEALIKIYAQNSININDINLWLGLKINPNLLPNENTLNILVRRIESRLKEISHHLTINDLPHLVVSGSGWSVDMKNEFNKSLSEAKEGIEKLTNLLKDKGSKSRSENSLPENEQEFVDEVIKGIKKGEKIDKRGLDKLGEFYAISDPRNIKELTELAIVIISREIALGKGPAKEKYDKIVALYKDQPNISIKTSESMMLQQYSTPSTIGYLMGLYISSDNNDKDAVYFDPSAGNGALTIAMNPKDVIVNEIDELRYKNLKSEGFKEVWKKDASVTFEGYNRYFSGVVANPPFGALEDDVMYDSYGINSLEQHMALIALNTLKNRGKSAIIIGGHTEYDPEGRIQKGKNRIFFSYLFKHYNVVDAINIDGAKLYSRMGTSYDVRLILINGRMNAKEVHPPLSDKNWTALDPYSSVVVRDFDTLFERVHQHI